MKKLIAISAVKIAAILLMGVPTAMAAYTVSPVVVHSGAVQINISLDADRTVNIFAPSPIEDISCASYDGAGNFSTSLNDLGCGTNWTYGSAIVGTYSFIQSDNTDPNNLADCNNGTIAQCRGSSAYISEYSVVYLLSSGSEVNMDSVISNASTTFSSAVGFNWADVVTFMKSLLLLVIGSGLGLLETLLPYIIALITIGAIVYFLYRAFRFFRH